MLLLHHIIPDTVLAASVGQASPEYVRPVDAAPSAEDIGAGYTTPAVQRPPPRSTWSRALDVALLAAALGVSAWVVVRRRSRSVLVVLMIGCLLYFGFYRKGCVCPIGAIQNVAVALIDPNYAIPYLVIATFFLPLIIALLFGRVYCGGVCPLGGIQELVLLRPVRVPRRLDAWLGLLRYVYLVLAVWYAVQPVVDRDFIICRFDPFVGLFRRTGTAEMLGLGGAFLLAGIFIGRPYCRYLCPYGGLLSLLSRLAWRNGNAVRRTRLRVMRRVVPIRRDREHAGGTFILPVLRALFFILSGRSRTAQDPAVRQGLGSG